VPLDAATIDRKRNRSNRRASKLLSSRSLVAIYTVLVSPPRGTQACVLQETAVELVAALMQAS